MEFHLHMRHQTDSGNCSDKRYVAFLEPIGDSPVAVGDAKIGKVKAAMAKKAKLAVGTNDCMPY